ncbi:MAG: asparagine synthase (glutamine-hydrolyzing), partial [Ignavibacteriae bacterium]|nr:asparagine synthase (glutamine-hydrolyzing) [Ignavibacteriota bacterium]
MCGIAGIYSKSEKNFSPVIKKMMDSIRHRGPDDEGYYVGSPIKNSFYELIGEDSKISGERIENFSSMANLFLGHRRLSILDLSPMGHQPMLNGKKNLAMIFNGEIYNYIEIKEELKALGCCFRTNSDTEVLLTAYEVWGEKCLEKFNGMWAFVIYDKAKNMLFGSRDRFGVKPFYYYIDGEHFAFASEIKALLNLPFYEKKINSEAVYDYLVLNQMENDEEGFFKNILELKPSFAFSYNLKDGNFIKWKYYNLKHINEWGKFEIEKSKEYIKNTKELVYNAVNLRLRSDVPVGSCLSGGLDSSAVVCIVNDLFRQKNVDHSEKQKVFTASYKGSDIDESNWAKIVADKSQVLWY